MRFGEQLSVLASHHQTRYDDLLKPGSKRKLEIKIIQLTAYKVYKILIHSETQKEANYFLGQGNAGSIFKSVLCNPLSALQEGNYQGQRDSACCFLEASAES